MYICHGENFNQYHAFYCTLKILYKNFILIILNIEKKNVKTILYIAVAGKVQRILNANEILYKCLNLFKARGGGNQETAQAVMVSVSNPIIIIKKIKSLIENIEILLA